METSGAQPLAQKTELKGLVDRHHTKMQVLDNLVNGGVKPEDLDEVLQLRSVLTTEDVKSDADLRSPGEIITKITQNEVSASVLAQAYKAVDGDLEDLAALVHAASDLAADRKYYPGSYTTALRTVTDLYQDGGLAELYKNDKEE